ARRDNRGGAARRRLRHAAPAPDRRDARLDRRRRVRRDARRRPARERGARRARRRGRARRGAPLRQGRGRRARRLLLRAVLRAAALLGAFQGRVDGPLNYVNAPLVAAERGIEVHERRQSATRNFTNLLRVGVRSDGDEVRVAGTTIGRDHRRWLVSALGFQVEFELAPLLVFFRYDDVPGVIGR